MNKPTIINILKTFLLCLFLLCVDSLFAQKTKEHILSINPGIMFLDEYGSECGFANEISYQSSWGRRFFLRENIGSWLVDSSYDRCYNYSSGYDVSAEIGWSVFKGKKRSLNLSIGPNILWYNGRSYIDMKSKLSFGIQYAFGYYSKVGQYLIINTRIVHKCYLEEEGAYIPNAFLMYSVGLGVNLSCFKNK